MLRLAWGVRGLPFLLETHHVLGQVLYFLAELVAAREHLEQGIALYDPQQHHSHAFLYGHDLGITCLGYVALVLWYLGYPAQALQKSGKTLLLAQDLSRPYSLAYAPIIAARLHQLRREGQTAKERVETVLTLSTKQGFPFLLALGTIVRG